MREQNCDKIGRPDCVWSHEQSLLLGRRHYDVWRSLAIKCKLISCRCMMYGIFWEHYVLTFSLHEVISTETNHMWYAFWLAVRFCCVWELQKAGLRGMAAKAQWMAPGEFARKHNNCEIEQEALPSAALNIISYEARQCYRTACRHSSAMSKTTRDRVASAV